MKKELKKKKKKQRKVKYIIVFSEEYEPIQTYTKEAAERQVRRLLDKYEVTLNSFRIYKVKQDMSIILKLKGRQFK